VQSFVDVDLKTAMKMHVFLAQIGYKIWDFICMKFPWHVTGMQHATAIVCRYYEKWRWYFIDPREPRLWFAAVEAAPQGKEQNKEYYSHKNFWMYYFAVHARNGEVFPHLLQPLMLSASSKNVMVLWPGCFPPWLESHFGLIDVWLKHIAIL